MSTDGRSAASNLTTRVGALGTMAVLSFAVFPVALGATVFSWTGLANCEIDR